MTEQKNPRDGFRLITPLRVRYAECDLQGIVFNAHYLAFADVGFGRTSYTLLVHILRGEELLNVIKLTYVWFDPATDQVTPVSAKFIEAVSDFEIIRPERAVVSA